MWKKIMGQWLHVLVMAMFARQVSPQATLCFNVCTCRPPAVTCHVTSETSLPTFYYIKGYSTLKIYGSPQIFQLPPGTFQQPWGVTDLTIANTGIETLRCEDFRGLTPYVSTLRFGRNAFKEIPRCAVARFAKLANLYLNDCQIQSLVADDFAGMAALETLDLSGNAIRDIDVRAFTNMQKLKYLNFSTNKLSSLKLQQFKNLGTPSLEMLDLSNNRIENIARDSFDGISPNLKRLDLSHNRIAQAFWETPNTFLNFAELDALDLSGNPLTMIDNQQIRSTFPRLSSLSLAKCSLSALDWRDYRYLRSLNIANNGLAIAQLIINNRERPCDSDDLKSETCPDISVDVSGNRVTSLYVRLDYILSLDSITVNAKGSGLEQVYVNVTQNSTAKEAATVIVLNLSNNQLEDAVQVHMKGISEDKWNLSTNISMDLSDNNLETGLNVPLKIYSFTSNDTQEYGEVNICLFTNRSIEIWELDLSGNGISSFPADSCLVGEVRVLKLNRNNIRQIGKLSFSIKAHGVARIRTIELRKNGLDVIDGKAFDELPNLEILDLRDNFIKTLPEMTFLKSLKGFQFLFLDNNPLMCDCSMAWVQNYGVFYPQSDPPKAAISGRCSQSSVGYSVLCFNWGKTSCADSTIALAEQYRLGRVCEADNYFEIRNFDLIADGPNIQVKWLKVGPELLYGYMISYKSVSSQTADFVVGPTASNITISLSPSENYDICLTPILSRANILGSPKSYCKGIATGFVASPAVAVLSVLLVVSLAWGIAALILIIRNRPSRSVEDTIAKGYEVPIRRQSNTPNSEIYDEVDEG